ncbi:hypothetical protein OIO90_002823 [Microbotryomycetes sp. JL221]|nr:hypothetical protein OIO90_002823 [Microbotryomycetes sp. JL221]
MGKDDTSDDEDNEKQPLKSSRSNTRLRQANGRDKAILSIGIVLIVALLVIGSFSLYQYANQGNEIEEPSNGEPAELLSSSILDTDLAEATETQMTEPTASQDIEITESTSSAAPSTSQPSSGSESGGDGSSTGSPMTKFPGLSKNGIGIGLLPDYQDQILTTINEALGVKFSFYGWYAQLPESGEWDGSQILGNVLQDVKKSGAIFQPAVMPNKNNWKGLNKKENYQAKAIAKVLKQYTDEGIEVWLRFAHEINWYQTDGTYSDGTGPEGEDFSLHFHPAKLTRTYAKGVKLFKEAWATVYDAVKDNPLIRMFFTPNVAGSLDDYVRYYPDDLDSVHYLGPLYDKYCSKDGDPFFAMGETGTDWADATIEDKFGWMDQMTSEETAKAMPRYVGTMWFNYDKERPYKLWKSGQDSDNSFAKKWLNDGTSQEGGKFGNDAVMGRYRRRYHTLHSDDSEDLLHEKRYHDDESQESDRDQDTDLPPPSKRRRSHDASGRDKAILSVGIVLIVALLVIGSYSLYQYTHQEDVAEYPISRQPTQPLKPDVTVTNTVADTKIDSGSNATPDTTIKAVKTNTTSYQTSKPTGESSGGSSSSGSTGKAATTFPGLSKNGIGIGMLPDYQDQTLTQLNEALDVKFSFYGWYAQLPDSGEWDGSQILGKVFDDVVKSGAIFQPAVMPNKNNWNGLTPKDNYQAKAIAKVMKQFTDAGVEVWLRFAHEVNWYLSDGTYSGGTGPEGEKHFKTAWSTIWQEVKSNPLLRMYYSPNVAASLDDYVRYFPDDLESVHYIGLSDYYPRSKSERFVDHIKPFHDKYCKDGKIKFVLGETGVWWDAPIEEKFAWMDEMTSKETAKAVPNYIGTMWFNYDKEQAFKLYKAGSDSDNEFSKKWFHTDTSQGGARFGNA